MKDPFISVEGGPSEGYIDADVYFVMEDRSEWKLRYTFCYDDGLYMASDPMFSPGPYESFDDAKDSPPVEVQEKFKELEPELCRLIDARIAYMAQPMREFLFTVTLSFVFGTKARGHADALRRAEACAKVVARDVHKRAGGLDARVESVESTVGVPYEQ